MTKFTFIREGKDGDTNYSEFEAFTWYEALDQFIKFLRGAGYKIEDDSVGINVAPGKLHIVDGTVYTNITTFGAEEE